MLRPSLAKTSIPALFFLLLFAPANHAQTVNVSGRYKCAEAKVRGKAVPCQSTPLVLKDDGSYQIRGREGNYLINGEWLVLSDTQKHSRAKIAPGHRLIFQYRCGGGSCELTFERRTADLGKTSLS
jgi:hypothetical protein